MACTLITCTGHLSIQWTLVNILYVQSTVHVGDAKYGVPLCQGLCETFEGGNQGPGSPEPYNPSWNWSTGTR